MHAQNHKIMHAQNNACTKPQAEQDPLSSDNNTSKQGC